jgi:hypothetical protein
LRMPREASCRLIQTLVSSTRCNNQADLYAQGGTSPDLPRARPQPVGHSLIVRVLMREERPLRGRVTRRGRAYARGEPFAAEQSHSEPSMACSNQRLN